MTQFYKAIWCHQTTRNWESTVLYQLFTETYIKLQIGGISLFLLPSSFHQFFPEQLLIIQSWIIYVYTVYQRDFLPINPWEKRPQHDRLIDVPILSKVSCHLALNCDRSCCSCSGSLPSSTSLSTSLASASIRGSWERMALNFTWK